jgi:hypothetical protein
MVFSLASLVKSRLAEPKLDELGKSESASKGSPIANRSVELPATDLDNITVLTRKLPNRPILPWNHFDSPWLKVAPKGGSKLRYKPVKQTSRELLGNPEQAN